MSENLSYWPDILFLFLVKIIRVTIPLMVNVLVDVRFWKRLLNLKKIFSLYESAEKRTNFCH